MRSTREDRDICRHFLPLGEHFSARKDGNDARSAWRGEGTEERHVFSHDAQSDLLPVVSVVPVSKLVDDATSRDATRRDAATGVPVSCTARIGLAVRFATFRQHCRYEGARCARCTRGEDYERVVDLCNVCDDYRIAVSTVAACRRHRQREHENDLSQLVAES